MSTTKKNNKESHFKKGLLIHIKKFIKWLDEYGDTSQDQYDLWATNIGQQAKSFYYKNQTLGSFTVAPFIFIDAFFPAARKWLWNRQRFPIADAHFAMGFLFLYKATKNPLYYEKAIHFLNCLKDTKCRGYENFGWGYPFNWMTNGGLIKRFTPLITTTPYVYEAFSMCYEINGDKNMLEIMRSIAQHVAYDYDDAKIEEKVYACSYIPRKELKTEKFNYVVNANSYRAFMLTDAANRFGNEEYWKIARNNLNFVIESQRSDGSWLYDSSGSNGFIDHFHTCFVLKNLSKIERLTPHPGCRDTIKKGIDFYFKNLLDENDLPIPFAKKQRVTPYRRELYDYAESINLSVLQLKNYKEFNRILDSQLSDLIFRWQLPEGYFRTRQLLIGWNNVPYHRWAQSQLFRNLCFLHYHYHKMSTIRS